MFIAGGVFCVLGAEIDSQMDTLTCSPTPSLKLSSKQSSLMIYDQASSNCTYPPE